MNPFYVHSVPFLLNGRRVVEVAQAGAPTGNQWVLVPCDGDGAWLRFVEDALTCYRAYLQHSVEAAKVIGGEV